MTGRLLILLAAAALAAPATAAAAFPGLNGRLGFTAPGGLVAVALPGLHGGGDLVPLVPAGSGLHWSADGASIVYTSTVSGDPEVYRLDVATPGSLPQQLTSSPGRDADPSFSADGTSIAFTSERSGNADVWVMNADGTGQRQVTRDAGADQMPEYSPLPDHRIVFASDRTGDSELYLIQDDGTGEQRLTDDLEPDLDPTWRPDGLALAYANGDAGQEDIETLLLDGVSAPEFATADLLGYRHPTWSPDGTLIAFDAPGAPPQLLGTEPGTFDDPIRLRQSGAEPDWGPLAPVPDGSRPAPGKTVVGADPAVRFRLPGAGGTGTLREGLDYPIPLHTQVDAQPQGKPLPVDIDVAIRRNAPILRTTVTGGRYTMRKRAGALDLDLTPLTGCPAGRRAGASRLPPNDVSVRRRGGKGGVSTTSRRRHVNTYTRDTEYRIVETCRAMVIRVLDGKLRVRRTKGRLPDGSKQVVLRKGQRITIR